MNDVIVDQQMGRIDQRRLPNFLEKFARNNLQPDQLAFQKFYQLLKSDIQWGAGGGGGGGGGGQ